MKSEKTTQNDIYENAAETALSVMKHVEAQRQELEKLTRENLERSGSLAKIWVQTSLDLFDMTTRTAASFHRLAEDGVKHATGIARRTMETAKVA